MSEWEIYYAARAPKLTARKHKVQFSRLNCRLFALIDNTLVATLPHWATPPGSWRNSKTAIIVFAFSEAECVKVHRLSPISAVCVIVSTYVCCFQNSGTSAGINCVLKAAVKVAPVRANVTGYVLWTVIHFSFLCLGWLRFFVNIVVSLLKLGIQYKSRF